MLHRFSRILAWYRCYRVPIVQCKRYQYGVIRKRTWHIILLLIRCFYASDYSSNDLNSNGFSSSNYAGNIWSYRVTCDEWPLHFQTLVRRLFQNTHTSRHGYGGISIGDFSSNSGLSECASLVITFLWDWTLLAYVNVVLPLILVGNWASNRDLIQCYCI